MNEALPTGWAMARISDLAEVRLGKMLSPKAQQPGLIRRRYLRNENVRWGTIDFSDLKEMGFKAEELDRYAIRPGDLMVCEGGEPGRCAIYRGEFAPLMYQKALHRVRPESEVSPSLLRYWLEYLSRSGNLTPKIAQTTIQHLPLERFESLEIPLPARREQESIVSEIERLLTRIDSGANELERVRGQLTRYRATVLKAACEGRLVPTEAELARAEGRTYETANSLLEDILRQRAERFAVRMPGGRRDRRYTDPLIPSETEVCSLPEGWVWTTLDQLLVEPLRNGHSARAVEPSAAGGVRTLTLTAVTLGSFAHDHTKLTVADPKQVSELWLRTGDILIQRSNTPELVGTARLYVGPNDFAIFPDLLIRARTAPEIVPRFVEICLQSERVRRYFKMSAQGIAGSMPKIDQDVIRRALIPLPPVREQERIGGEVDRRFSIADEVLATIDAAIARAARLRQAILKRAYEGKLVPQDSNDEPASVQLERIRKEREAAAGEISSKPKRRRTGARSRKARV